MENYTVKTTGNHSRIGSLNVYSTYVKVGAFLLDNFYSNNLYDRSFEKGILKDLFFKFGAAGTKAVRNDYLEEFRRNGRLDIVPIVFSTEKELAKFPFFPPEIHINSSQHFPLQLLYGSFFIEPFKEIAKNNVDFLDCELPVNIFHGITGFTERILFLLTNNIQIDKRENDSHMGSMRENILPFIKNDI